MNGYANGSQPKRPQLLPPGARANRDHRRSEASRTISPPSAGTVRTAANSTSRPSRARRAKPPRSSSPNTTCREKKRCRTTWSSRQRQRLVFRFRLALCRRARSEDRQGDRLRAAGVPQGPAAGTLDLEPDPNGNLWVSMMYQAGVAKIDIKTKEVKGYPIPDEWVRAEHAELDGVAELLQCRQQGVDEQPVDARAIPARSRDRQMGKLGVGERPARQEDQPATACRSTRTTTCIMLEFSGTSVGLRRQGQHRHHLADADRRLAAAPRPHRREQQAVVRRICRQRHRHARHQDAQDQGMGAAEQVRLAL